MREAHGERLQRDAEGGTIRTFCKQHTHTSGINDGDHQPSFCCYSSQGSLRLLSMFGSGVVVVVGMDGWMDEERREERTLFLLSNNVHLPFKRRTHAQTVKIEGLPQSLFFVFLSRSLASRSSLFPLFPVFPLSMTCSAGHRWKRVLYPCLFLRGSETEKNPGCSDSEESGAVCNPPSQSFFMFISSFTSSLPLSHIRNTHPPRCCSHPYSRSQIEERNEKEKPILLLWRHPRSALPWSFCCLRPLQSMRQGSASKCSSQ